MQTFVSHNIRDKEIAREIAIFLAAENINVWFDEWEIAAGDSIVEKIESGLLDCSHFVILWSINSSKSNWVRRELSSALVQAISDNRLRVIPIVLDNTPLPPLIADLSYVRYQGGTEHDRAEIIRAIANQMPSNTFIKAIVKKYHELVRNSEEEDTLGYIACPKCGSLDIEPFDEVEVETDVGDDGSALHYPIYIAAVRCSDCDWTKCAIEKD
jgi:hypothetical protein